MLSKLSRLFYTVSYLKRVQIFYQIWYRIKNKFLKIDWYKKYENSELFNLKFSIHDEVIISKNKYLGNNKFQFLNLSHQFDINIDWNFNGHGKLWNYNLQYFDFLQDETIETNEREKLLEDFSKNLLKCKIKPEPYPVSLRVINSLIFISKNGISNKIINKGILFQINYLENNLEYHLLANHLLENVFTLFIASYAIKNETLNKKANKLLEKQLQEQILNDGAHYECSPMYHSIILSKLFLCIDLAKNNNYFNNNLDNASDIASKMLGWINEYSFPDGSWALMNDAALGIAPTTQVLVKTAKQLRILSYKSVLSDSGYRKIKVNDTELLIDVGNILPSFQPGHAHCDMLSFCLWHNNVQILVDSGISTYNFSLQRIKERGSMAHNTVTVNNVNQSDPWGAFRFGRRAKISLCEDSSKKIEASHDGYKSRFGLIHKRSFEALDGQIHITDILLGENSMKKLNFFSTYIFNEATNIKIIHSQKLIADKLEFNFENSSIDIKFDYYSTHFNKLTKCELVKCSFENSYSTKMSITYL